VREIQLITPRELEAIREIWVSEKHEHEDLLPRIFEKATGTPYPGQVPFDDQFPFSRADLEELRDLSKSELQYELLRELIGVEHKHRVAARRSGLWDDLEAAFSRSGYENADEAIHLAKALARGRDSVDAGSPVDFGASLLDVLEGDVRSEMT
jgi:DNA sulfur modification protein DndC